VRRKYFLGKGPQFKYLSVLIVSMTLPAILLGGCLYYFVFRIMEEQLKSTELIVQNLLPAIDKVNLIVIVVLPIAFCLLFIWGLVLSHRFAGPLERLRRELTEISDKGNFSRRLQVRKNDELKGVVDAMNAVLEKAQEKNVGV
jgi:methyl-accepting chemotaxis protein